MATVDTPEIDWSYSYDSAGRIASITGAGNTLAYTYDGSLPLSEAWAGTVAGTVSRTYDADLRVGSVTAAGSEVTYSYDDDGLITGVSGQAAATVERDPATGRPTRVDHGDVREDLSYDASFGELTAQDATWQGNPRYLVDYVRDKLGRVVEKTETIDGQTTVTDYAYDARGRLTDADASGSAPDYSYSYDENGNRTDGGRTYDAQDRLTGKTGATYSYTPDGYLASKTAGADTTTYTYNSVGQLSQAAGSGLNGTTQVDYLYDANGRRIQRNDGTTTHRYLWDGPRLVAVLDGSNNLLSRFTYLTQSQVPDLMRVGGTEYRLVSDQVGSVRLVINTQTGNVAQRLDYDPYGQVISDTSPGFQPFGFAGGLYDPATELTRFGARDYDAENGRWTAKDPVLFDGGLTSLYAYCGGDPINRADPSGLGPASGGPWKTPWVVNVVGKFGGAMSPGAYDWVVTKISPNAAVALHLMNKLSPATRLFMAGSSILLSAPQHVFNLAALNNDYERGDVASGVDHGTRLGLGIGTTVAGLAGSAAAPFLLNANISYGFGRSVGEASLIPESWGGGTVDQFVTNMLEIGFFPPESFAPQAPAPTHYSHASPSYSTARGYY